MEDAGKLLGAVRINKAQVDSYAEGDWEFAARDEEVCVLHTLVVPLPLLEKAMERSL